MDFAFLHAAICGILYSMLVGAESVRNTQSFCPLLRRMTSMTAPQNKSTGNVIDIETLRRLNVQLTMHTSRVGQIDRQGTCHSIQYTMGRDLQRIKYLFSKLIDTLHNNGSRKEWAEGVLSLAGNNIDYILSNIHDAITGKSLLADRGVYATFMEKTFKSKFTMSITDASAMLNSFQCAGYVVWMAALEFQNRNREIETKVLPAIALRTRVQGDLLNCYKYLVDWPRQFGYVKPKVGCPPDFREGYRTHRVRAYSLKRSAKWESHSEELSADQNTTTHDYLNWKFCSNFHTSNTMTVAHDKHRGTYCTLASSNPEHCQHKLYTIHWDDLDITTRGYFNMYPRTNPAYGNSNGRTRTSNNGNKFGGAMPFGYYTKDTTINLCCRNDASVTSTVLLPTHTPFYLFPYKASYCQKVHGMKSQIQWLRWYTEAFENADSCPRGPPALCADNSITLYMCYYERDETRLCTSLLK